MREIKFRAWLKDDKKMKVVNIIDLNFGSISFSELTPVKESNPEFDEIEVLFSEVELMQYSGVKDRKGKEIYESDIVKAKIGVMDFVLKVVFENSKFMAVGDDDLTAFDLFTIADKCEVIGNIYENSELLK